MPWVLGFGALALLAVAAVGAAAVWMWYPAENQPSPQTSDEFGWLTEAMMTCDAEAAQTPGTLFFIVIPLMADRNDVAPWRAKSLNDIGNGVLLNSAVALDGLKEKALKISNEPYVFIIRDQSQVVYKWKQSRGVARFSTPDADSIMSFNIQFLAGADARETEWGAGFSRQKGSCYWVNAIVGI